MADTIARLAGPVAGTGAEATLVTGAAAGTVVRAIRVTNTTTTQQTFKMSIGADAAGTRLYHDETVSPSIAYDWSGLIYLASAETLRWTAPTTLTVTINGLIQ